MNVTCNNIEIRRVTPERYEHVPVGLCVRSNGVASRLQVRSMHGGNKSVAGTWRTKSQGYIKLEMSALKPCKVYCNGNFETTDLIITTFLRS